MNDELQHYGILGMRWGIRRYQNADGTLTPAGRRRYGVGEGENVQGIKGAKTKQIKQETASEHATGKPAGQNQNQGQPQSSQNSSGNQQSNQQQNQNQSSQNSSGNQQNQQNQQNQPTIPKPDYRLQVDMSNDELQAFLNRAALEERYFQYINSKKPKKTSLSKVIMNDILGPAAKEVAKKWTVDQLTALVSSKPKDDKKADKKADDKGKKPDESVKQRLDRLEKLINSVSKGSPKKDDSTSKDKPSDKDSGKKLFDTVKKNVEKQQAEQHRRSILAAARQNVRSAQDRQRRTQSAYDFTSSWLNNSGQNRSQEAYDFTSNWLRNYGQSRITERRANSHAVRYIENLFP